MSKQFKPKAIAYLRIGSRPQFGNSASGDKQKLQIMAAASRLGLQIVHWFEVSGRTNEQLTDKVVQEMLGYCRLNREVEYMILTSPDRLTRSIATYYVIKDALQKLGVTIVAAHSEAELNSSQRQLEELMMIGLAQMARNERSAFTKKALKRKKEGRS